MNENEMGYRGSKSLCFLIKKQSVKEQRVDGSWFLNKFKNLRCTLMGFEKNYQIKIPSKQLINNFSTKIYPNKIEPWFLTGFTDAEGCFGLYIYKNANYKTGWFISLVFQISLHEKDKIILEQIQNYFLRSKSEE